MRTVLLPLLLIFSVILSAASGAADERMNKRHNAAYPERIVSLAPGMTEILFALGLGDRIAGVTSFCDYPEEARNKSAIGGMSNPSLEAVVSLRPDIVVMTTDGNPKEFEERLRLLDIRTYVFTARTIAELPGGIRELGSAVGVNKKAKELAYRIETSTSRMTVDQRRQHDARRGKSKKVVFVVWPEPLIVAGPGTAIDDAIALLGHQNIASTAPSPYPKYSIEAVITQSPDVIFIGRGHVNMKEIAKGLLKKLSMLPAVTNGAVYYVSDSLYRLGPRVITGIEELEECLR